MKGINKRIVIHVGPGKTGSSAIQAWLSSNQATLNENKICYPKHDISRNKISSGNLAAILSKEESNKWVVDATKITALLEEFQLSNDEILLLSSEYFFHSIFDIHQYIPEAEFVIYVRNPLELVESNYNQGVKRHGFIHPFSVPATMDKFFWGYVFSIVDKIGSNRFHFRAYCDDVVADFLSFFSITVQASQRHINLSYTLPALEFKRLINHFDIVKIQPKIDDLLQAYTEGKSSYSFIDSASYKKLSIQCVNNAKAFTEQYPQFELKALLSSQAETYQREFVPQCVTLNELQNVARFIQRRDPATFLALKNTLERNPNLILASQDIYHCFGIEPSSPEGEFQIDQKLLATIKKFTVHESKPAKICFELAGFYLDANDLTNGLLFAKAAYYFNPKSYEIIARLNLIQAKANSLADEKRDKPSFLLRRSMYQIKSWLKDVKQRSVKTKDVSKSF